MRKHAIQTMLFILLIITMLVIQSCSTSGGKNGCTPPPEGFSEKDLVGTWFTGWSERNDTLTFREDGTYKQIIYIKYLDLQYESEWLPWRLEFAETGIPYLYLEGMRLCGYVPDLIDCEQVGGGEEDWEAFNQNYWHDFCRDEFILMPDGGVLMVLGVPEGPTYSTPPRGIDLWLPTIIQDSPWVYTLQEP